MSTKKKILFFVYQTGNKANGGVESISQVIENINEFLPIIITQAETDVVKIWREMGFEVIVWKWYSNKILNLIINNIRSLIICLKIRNIAAVHCNDIDVFVQHGFGAFFALKKVVLNVRGIKESKYSAKWKIAVKVVSKIIVLSEDMKLRLMYRLKIRENKIQHIYSIVDFNKFKSRQPRVFYNAKNRSEYIIGCVGAFFPIKQQLKFLQEASDLLLNMPNNIKFVFVGDFNVEENDYARKCLVEYNSKGLQNHIEFLGYKSEMNTEYANFDLNIIISEREGLSRSMIESLSVGVPVVSFDVASANEILEQFNCGVVIKQGDYVSLIGKIVELIANKNELIEFAENGIRVSRELFDSNRIISQYEEVYSCLN